ncbi:MAG: endonuclease/exonuclease/phosphatase family protein [Gammaproteobacteria bacterium]|nr:MAG: endonuclease/exonuclease/phosphatase family protein [Gammaproteobacteria bacterium]RLA30067.1 MAG: endonuclease/exonuclease/phosphatase family protein [Gammaproteobacteria bacterium]
MNPYARHSLLKIQRAMRALGYVVSGLLLSSCAHQYVEQLSQVSANAMIHHVPTANGVQECRELMAADITSTGAELDSSNIRLLNWNIQKQRNTDSTNDLRDLADGKDLILIQEASLREETINDVDSSKHWSFAPGYLLDGEVTGVMTLSSIKPLTQCSFVTLEPILRSPKATSITEYALSDTDLTLAVVNMHVVNFSLGLKAFREQIENVHHVLETHNGPVILSGDFNTWRRQRMLILEQMTEKLGLNPVDFGDDKRVRLMGNLLDHLYVRGLSATDASTESVITSDHNPMSATLAM